MAIVAAIVLSAGVLLGMAVAVLHARPSAGRMRARLGLLHGALGAAGFAVLAAGRFGGGADTLTWDAVALLAAALLAGATYYAWVRRGRPPDTVLLLHGSLGFIGYVLLVAAVR